jgi:hypothetical protein
MGEIIDIRDYSDDGLERTMDSLLAQTTDIHQLLDRLGSLNEAQKRKILGMLRKRMQTKSDVFDGDGFSFNELDSELMRAAHRDRRQKEKLDETLKKERRNKTLQRLRKYFSVQSKDESFIEPSNQQEYTAGMGHHHRGTPVHPILSKDNNQFFGKEDTEMNANPVQNADTEAYNDKRPVHAPVHQPTAKPDFRPSNAPTPLPPR